jgi:hypothetical protein
MSLVNSIIEAHGGLERYNKLDTITFKMDFTGATLGMKQRPQHLIPTGTTYVKEQKTVYRGLGGSTDEEWVFTPTKVWKQRISDGGIIDSRENPRASFEGHTLETPWDDLQFLYFCGYAMYQYFHWPYLLARDDVQTKELAPYHESNQTWRVLEVIYPDHDVLATHVRTQKYYVDETFILRRHDYAPDVLAGAQAAHYVFDPITVGGLTFASLRHIVAIGPVGENGSPAPMWHGPIPTLIHLVILKIALKGMGGSEDIWALSELPAK